MPSDVVIDLEIDGAQLLDPSTDVIGDYSDALSVVHAGLIPMADAQSDTEDVAKPAFEGGHVLDQSDERKFPEIGLRPLDHSPRLRITVRRKPAKEMCVDRPE